MAHTKGMSHSELNISQSWLVDNNGIICRMICGPKLVVAVLGNQQANCKIAGKNRTNSDPCIEAKVGAMSAKKTVAETASCVWCAVSLFMRFSALVGSNALDLSWVNRGICDTKKNERAG